MLYKFLDLLYPINDIYIIFLYKLFYFQNKNYELLNLN